jgi:hypothetical protein
VNTEMENTKKIERRRLVSYDEIVYAMQRFRIAIAGCCVKSERNIEYKISNTAG